MFIHEYIYFIYLDRSHMILTSKNFYENCVNEKVAASGSQQSMVAGYRARFLTAFSETAFKILDPPLLFPGPCLSLSDALPWRHHALLVTWKTLASSLHPWKFTSPKIRAFTVYTVEI